MTPEQKKFIQTLINRLNNLEARLEKLERKEPTHKKTGGTVVVPAIDFREKYKEEYKRFREANKQQYEPE